MLSTIFSADSAVNTGCVPTWLMCWNMVVPVRGIGLCEKRDREERRKSKEGKESKESKENKDSEDSEDSEEKQDSDDSDDPCRTVSLSCYDTLRMCSSHAMSNLILTQSKLYTNPDTALI